MLELKTEELEIAVQDERIAYHLVRIDDNGLFLPVTDEDLMEVESLIQAEMSEDDIPTDQDDEKDSRQGDLEDVKMRLLKQLEVVDTMLLKVKNEDDQRSSMDCTGGAKFTYKRRRRPNPKYFNVTAFDSAGDLLPLPEAQLVKVEAVGMLEEEPICSSSKPAPAPPLLPETNTYTSPMTFLDNLSIRALQDTYRDTFGKETSAKDKHWLKRKIAKGLSAMGEGNNGAQQTVSPQENVQERLEVQVSAEQPFCATNNVEEVKPKVSSAISPTVSLDASTTTVVSRPSEGQSQLNEVQSLEGKRHRKPNRRYVEDEADDLASSFGRMIPSAGSPENVPQQSIDPEFCWKSDDDEDDDEDFDEEGMEMSDPLDSLSPEGDGFFGSGKRSSGSFGAERRAAQLVKMARNARAIRKIKFKLPAAQGQDNDENYEPNDDSADQVSCMLPSVSDELQPSDAEDQDVDRKTGSRRKHHRPWTLKEVIALVDGVSRCGTGKWADIKRLSFSAITYRTPVDLKDKWRNLLRASRVHSHSSRQQGEKRRKHFSVSIPPNVLAKVRELAAQPGQTVKLPVIRSTRSRRMMQRQNKL